MIEPARPTIAYRKTTLDNGLRLITESMPHTRSVAINFFIGTGSRYESEPEAGVSHFIEHVCFKGTKRRPSSLDICSVIEGYGGMINAGTDKELTVYWAKVAQAHFRSALDVLSDILLHATFDPIEIEKERQVIAEEIHMTLDSPAQRVGLLIDDLLWPNHPLGRDIAGTQESLAAIDRPLMMNYLEREYRPGNVVLSIAGGIDEDKVIQLVDRTLGKWKPGPARPGFLPYQPSPGRAIHIERKDTEQTQLCLSVPGLAITDEDRFVLGILNIILGEGMSSRLFSTIRDNLGLAYSIQSFAEHFLDTGAWTIAAGVENNKLKVAVNAILEQFALLKDGIPEEELTRAKELYKGRTLLRMEDSRNVAGWMGAQEILHDYAYTVDEVLGRVDSITTDDLQRIAKRLLVSEQLRCAVVGPIDPDTPLDDILKL